MRLHTLLSLTSTLGVLSIVSCSDAPTQPRTSGSPAPAAKPRAAASDTWTEKAPLPGGPDGSFAGTGPNAAGQSMIYVFGGHIGPGTGINVRAYDLATDTWVNKSARVDESDANGVGTIGKLMYFTGGYVFDGGHLVHPFLYEYDPVLDRLTRKADMPRPTLEGVTGVMNRKLYVLTGDCQDNSPQGGFDCDPPKLQPYFYRYDPATDTWSTDLPPAPHFHRRAAGGVIHGKFYVAGGDGTADLDVYDPKTNTWTTLAPLPTPGTGIGAVLNDQLVAVIGPEFSDLQPKTYAYDPRSDSWETRAAYPRRGVPKSGTARATYHGHDYMLTFGGTDNFERPLPSLLYTP